MALNILGVTYTVKDVPIVSRDEFGKGFIDFGDAPNLERRQTAKNIMQTPK